MRWGGHLQAGIFIRAITFCSIATCDGVCAAVRDVRPVMVVGAVHGGGGGMRRKGVVSAVGGGRGTEGIKDGLRVSAAVTLVVNRLGK